MASELLLNPFSALTFHSHGSPAPWQTSPSSLPLHLRTLVSAILSLSTALQESSSQLETIASLLDRSHRVHSELRQAVFVARDRVLATSHEAQLAHAEAKRVDSFELVFKNGADRAVASLDRRILRALRKGKMRAFKLPAGGGVLLPRPPPSPQQQQQQGDDDDNNDDDDDVCPVMRQQIEDEFAAFNFVEELLLDLDVEYSQLSDAESPSSTLELDDEWLAMEEELVDRLATKARDRGNRNFRRTSLWRRQRAGSDASTTGESDGATTDGEDALSDAGSDRISSPSTPPSSVHSTDDSELESLHNDDGEGDEGEPRVVVRQPSPDYDTLVELLTPLIHPVLLLLFRLRHLLSLKLTTAIDAFESLVKASADAVKDHRDSVTRLNKNAAKIRDLKDLERRECEEEERLLGEFRGVVVELARVRKFPTHPSEDIDALSEDEDEEGADYNDDVE